MNTNILGRDANGDFWFKSPQRVTKITKGVRFYTDSLNLIFFKRYFLLMSVNNYHTGEDVWLGTYKSMEEINMALDMLIRSICPEIIEAA